MAGPRASSGLLRNRIRRQSSLTPPSVSPTMAAPSGGGPPPKVRLESLVEEAQFPGATEACTSGSAEQVQAR
ncbi:hypothetical protein LEL_10141 [Akanthomyces lecanii RCEF 1005]|uniref:Uncharacterized protein n=1 Tax=Akanthomyces lecanii RCEF 1005 TaxID=1081108 RepID=A0A168AW08_CORDF|nr:hypothetical protein LEL_10141 [Akanthomyces lecanii RCEF 1005]